MVIDIWYNCRWRLNIIDNMSHIKHIFYSNLCNTLKDNLEYIVHWTELNFEGMRDIKFGLCMLYSCLDRLCINQLKWDMFHLDTELRTD